MRGEGEQIIDVYCSPFSYQLTVGEGGRGKRKKFSLKLFVLRLPDCFRIQAGAQDV
jgi:hypothetical protein